jgi:hypothetical protein
VSCPNFAFGFAFPEKEARKADAWNMQWIMAISAKIEAEAIVAVVYGKGG